MSKPIDPHLEGERVPAAESRQTEPFVHEIRVRWGDCDPDNPKNRRRRPSILVESGGGRLLVDTSPDLREQLLAADVWEIDAILYTHTHADHVSDMVPLVQALNLLDPPRDKPLDVFGPPGIGEFVEHRVLPVSSHPTAFEVRTSEVLGEIRHAGYVVAYTPDGAGGWRLHLEPRSQVLRALIASIRVEGRGTQLERMQVQETSGDSAVTVFSDVEIGSSFAASELESLFSLRFALLF